MGNTTKQETKEIEENMEITKEISVPSFLANKPTKESIITPRRKKIQEQQEKEKRKLKFISCREDQSSWNIMKELDELVGIILSTDNEPTSIEIKYTINTRRDNKSEKIRGIISI